MTTPLLLQAPSWSNIVALISVLAVAATAMVTVLKFRSERRAAKLTSVGERAIRVMELLYDGLIVVDADDIIIVANEQVRLMSGYKELLGMNFTKLIPERFQARHKKHVANYRHNPYPRPMGRNMELWLLTRAGVEIPVLLTLRPMESIESGGTMETIVGIRAIDNPIGAQRREGDLTP